MKKLILSTAILVGLIGLSGCGSKQPQPKTPQCTFDGVKAPEWVCNEASDKNDGYLYAVASAEKSPLGLNFQKEEAVANARNALAQQISIKVKNMFKKFEATTGVGKDQTAEKAVENVSKQVANQTLRNSKIVSIWKSPKGTLFVLVGMPKNSIKTNIKTSLKSEKALWQKFLAQKADKELDKEIDKEFGGN